MNLASNTAATRLYEAIGMHAVGTNERWEKTLGTEIR